MTDSNFSRVIGVAESKRGDLYVSYVDSSGVGSVAVFPSGTTTPQETGISLVFPGGVAFDAAGHLLVADQTHGTLSVFDVGNPKPVATFTLPGDSAFFCFNPTKKRLYVADFESPEIDVFNYSPTKLEQVNKITKGLSAGDNVLGIAITQGG